MKSRRSVLALIILAGAAALITAGLLLLGMTLEQWEQAGPLGGDAWLMQAIRSALGPAAEGMMLQISALGSKTVLSLVVVLTVLALWLARESILAAKVLIVGIGAGSLTWLVKHWIERPRPQILPWMDEWVGQSYSFPSGHALSSMAIYVALAVLLSRLAPNRATARFTQAAAVGVSVMIGCSRVYLGVHYPSDVLAGWLAGLTWAMASVLALRVWLPMNHRNTVR